MAKEHAGDAYRILVRPVYSEKAAQLEALGKYTFIVARNANKNTVAQAVRDLYGVKPASVRISVKEGKKVRFGRSTGVEKTEKKAVVTLKPGESITVAEAA
ncbi:50S ribosomal protein L23 [Candidatus Uhrbacteria bacterium RIFCSPHIGHO2_02_FULL_60_10]|uniref:Large ribosomal subunit protein uL23 n=1 Tax=Candidatus Uhrbacteria bacterium RIFCSPHIGHO2_02_FULL_60_10 TaxID=1802392 RepID=A0A1F7U2N1_9BACT|nr:MAG: 50S ribosomal protein L23 [Candidatus Uhrbacteria bacterium RIFCSPHIGHO2_02_FULL_60_10]